MCPLMAGCCAFPHDVHDVTLFCSVVEGTQRATAAYSERPAVICGPDHLPDRVRSNRHQVSLAVPVVAVFRSFLFTIRTMLGIYSLEYAGMMTSRQ